MKDKLKYLFFFLVVTTAAYAGSTLFLYYLDREIVRELPFPVPPRSSAEKNVSPTPSPAEDSKAVAKNPLSLEQEEVLSKKTSSVQKKPTLSSLRLKLLGTVVNEKGLSWAIIQDLDRDRQDLVSVGSVVAGVRVVSIGRDRVVLSVNGREEILLLGSEETRPAGSRKDQASKESTTSTYVVSREVVKENLDNLPSLLMQARAELYFKEGRPEGFQLSQIQKGSLLKSVGFEDGDVIRSVNGKEIRSLEDAIALYQQLGETDSYTIGILRGEKPKTMYVRIR